jgi:hypothetical protein
MTFTSGALSYLNNLQNKDRVVTVNLSGVTFQEALDQVGLINKKAYRVLDRNTLLIFDDSNQQTRQRWDDQVMRTFYLENVDAKDLEAPLSIVCTNIETGGPVIFSRDSAPEMNVATAVRCSVGIPGLFAVKRVNGAVLVDGGLTPIDESLLFPDGSGEVLTIRMMRDRQTRPMRSRFGWSAYIQRIASLLLDAGDDPRFFPAPSQRILMIRTGTHSAVDFDLSPQDKHDLYQAGYDQCQALLECEGTKRRPTLPSVLREVDENLERLNEAAYAT